MFPINKGKGDSIRPISQYSFKLGRSPEQAIHIYIEYNEYRYMISVSNSLRCKTWHRDKESLSTNLPIAFC